MLPASAITRPVLTRIMKVWKSSLALMWCSAISLPPYQKSRAHVHVIRLMEVPSPSPANHDCRMLSLRGPSCDCSKRCKMRSWDEKAVIVRRLETASAASLLLSACACIDFLDMLLSKTRRA
uniref:Uncharacterized protein n=1 Tax=Oryza nivara TaxID=4536 RepID=A0A0E0G342_ORYNI